MFRQPRLTALDHCTIGMSGDQIIRRAHHGRCASAGQCSRDRLFPSVSGHVGSQGRDGAPWRRPGCRGQPDARVEPTTLPPGLDRPTPGRRCLERASHGFGVDAIDACRAVRIQHPWRLRVDLDIDRAECIPGTPSRANAVAVWFKRRFPGGLPDVFDQRVRGASGPGRNPQGTLLRRAGCGKIPPTDRRGMAREGQVVHHVQSLLGRQLRRPPRRLGSAGLGDPASRSVPRAVALHGNGATGSGACGLAGDPHAWRLGRGVLGASTPGVRS